MTYERTCKYGCNSQLGEFETKENKYLETDGKTLHTRERCESLKKNQTHKEITLQEVIKKLESIGIIINVERLMKQ
jgi:hypothetical protein